MPQERNAYRRSLTASHVVVAAFSLLACCGGQVWASTFPSAVEDDDSVPAAQATNDSQKPTDHDGTLITVISDQGQAEYRGKVGIGKGTANRHVMLCNTHTRSVTLSIVRSSCSCVHTELSRNSVLPGDAVPLDLSVDVADLSGTQRHGVLIRAESHSESGESLTEEFSVTVSYIPDRRVEIVPWWIVRRSIALVPDEWVYSVAQRFPGDLRIPQPTISIEWVRPSVPEVSPANRWVQIGKLSATPPSAGVYNGGLHLKLDDSESTESVVIPVTVQVLDAWRAEPPGWVADSPIESLPATWTSRLTPRDPRSPTPTSVTVLGGLPGLKARLDQDNRGWLITVERDANERWESAEVSAIVVKDQLGRQVAEARLVRLPPAKQVKK